MNGYNNMLVSIVSIFATIAVVALLASEQVHAIFSHKGIKIELLAKARARVSRASAVLIALFVLASIVGSSWWWLAQPKNWRMLVARQLGEVVGLIVQGSGRPLEINTGKETLDELVRTIGGFISELQENPHARHEIWIVDHYWRYWLSDNFDEYLARNAEFVRNGGSIHRMFVLNENDIEDSKSGLERMLRRQCSIATNQATDVTSNDFELWLVHPDIRSSEPYKHVAEKFKRLFGAAAEFEKFDIVQFDIDTLYFSDSFSHSPNGLKENLGRSIWIFRRAQISEVHLEDLFKAKNSAANPFKCARFQESFKELTGRNPAEG